jgi:hypothetical protein
MTGNAGKALLNRLPDDIADGLSEPHRDAIAKAGSPSSPAPPVDIRLRIPLGPKRFYFAIYAGRERRSADRQAEERILHPLLKLGNMLFFIAGLAIIYMMALIGVMLFSSTLDF